MNGDSYHMSVWIGFGIGISVGNIFSSVLGIKSNKSGIGLPIIVILKSQVH